MLVVVIVPGVVGVAFIIVVVVGVVAVVVRLYIFLVAVSLAIIQLNIVSHVFWLDGGCGLRMIDTMPIEAGKKVAPMLIPSTL